MIDYLERLEAEVTKAARAEEARRRPRVVLPRVSPRVLIPAGAVAAALLILVLALPRPAEVERAPVGRGAAPAAAVGSYSRGPQALILDPDRYTIDTPAAEIKGDLSARSGVLRFGSDPNGECAGLGPGDYAFRASARGLELLRVQDPCPVRADALSAGAWTRDGG